MTKIVHEFCGICIQRRYIAGCSSGVWGGGLRFGEESCLCGSSYTLGMLHLFCIARHSLLGVRQGCGLQPFAACSAAGRTEEQPISAPSAACGGCAPKRACGRSAHRSGCFCTALRAIARHSLLVVGQGCYLHPFAACSAAGKQRNILALRSGCFCTALRAIARHSRAGKKITFPQKRKS